jgi:hypothetical protein
MIFLGGGAYLLAVLEGREKKSVRKVQPDPELLLIDVVGFEPEFAYLIELLEFQLKTEVRVVGGTRGKTVSFETDDDLVARLSFHQGRHIVVRLSDYQFGLQAWFTAAFPCDKVRFQSLKPIATIKKRTAKKNKTPRGR